MSFPLEHLATVLKYGGISFIAGAVNHGFFSESRSLATAALGVAFYILGAVLDLYREGKSLSGWTSAFGLAIIFSIGIGFFTGGLQHFPDSPERSAWVVPLGFALSLLSLFVMDGRFKMQQRSVALYAAVSLAVVTAGSFAGYRWYDGAEGDGHDHSHAHGHGHGGGHSQASPAAAKPPTIDAAPAFAAPVTAAAPAVPPPPRDTTSGAPLPSHATGASAPSETVAAPAPGVEPAPVSAKSEVREIVVLMNDEMRFVPSQISVRQGEKVAFKVTNVGKTKHEFVLGTEKELRQHAAEMKKMAAGGAHHRHDGHSHAGQSVSMEGGETKTMVVTFDKAGDLRLGCFEPGHYEAGMRGSVQIARRN